MGATIEGLRPRGELVAIGATPEPIPVSPLQLIMSSKSVHGHPSGTAREVEETMRFAELAGVRAMIETRPLAEADAAYQRMLSGQARYRMVLTTGT
jgi:alcohol dehydrogenase